MCATKTGDNDPQNLETMILIYSLKKEVQKNLETMSQVKLKVSKELEWEGRIFRRKKKKQAIEKGHAKEIQQLTSLSLS